MIHVLRITEEAEKKPSECESEKSSEATSRNAKPNSNVTTVNLAKPLSLLKPKTVAFVQVGCEKPKQVPPITDLQRRPVQLASVKLHKSTELGPDVYLMQGKFARPKAE